jgi:hypothetical protein
VNLRDPGALAWVCAVLLIFGWVWLLSTAVMGDFLSLVVVVAVLLAAAAVVFIDAHRS